MYNYQDNNREKYSITNKIQSKRIQDRVSKKQSVKP